MHRAFVDRFYLSSGGWEKPVALTFNGKTLFHAMWPTTRGRTGSGSCRNVLELECGSPGSRYLKVGAEARSRFAILVAF